MSSSTRQDPLTKKSQVLLVLRVGGRIVAGHRPGLLQLLDAEDSPVPAWQTALKAAQPSPTRPLTTTADGAPISRSVGLDAHVVPNLNSSASNHPSPLRRRTRLTCASTTQALTPEINSETSARQLRRSSKVSRASTRTTPSNVRRRQRQPTVPVNRAHKSERRYTSTYIQAPPIAFQRRAILQPKCESGKESQIRIELCD